MVSEYMNMEEVVAMLLLVQPTGCCKSYLPREIYDLGDAKYSLSSCLSAFLLSLPLLVQKCRLWLVDKLARSINFYSQSWASNGLA